MKVAIVYDRVNKWGGAERVLLTLHEIFPDAPLFTSVYDPRGAPWAKVFPEVVPSFLQKVPFARKYHEALPVFMPLAFSSHNLKNFDLVISVTSEAAKGVKAGKKTVHICYCLTPTRYLWSHHSLYFKNPIFKYFSAPLVNALRKWDKKAAKGPHEIIAISSEVKDRIKKYYRREAEIIFPPVTITKNKGTTKNQTKTKEKTKNKHYLLVGRLDYGYKKVELAIEAFNKLGKPLVIVGIGRMEGKLKSLTKSRKIKFAGKVSETKLSNYYKEARALIMPQEEDFGIVAVEAQMHGIPVIAYKKGGAIDTVIPGKTGIFFSEQTPESLIDAVNKFEKMKFDRKALLLNSQRFSKTRFKKELLALISKHSIQ